MQHGAQTHMCLPQADEKMDPTAALKFANTRTKPTAFSFGPSLQVRALATPPFPRFTEE